MEIGQTTISPAASHVSFQCASIFSSIDYFFLAPCRLPHFKNGQYLSGYRGGLTIAHGAKIQYQCEPDFTRSPQSSIVCENGELLPAPPSCRPKGSVANFAQTGAGITRTSGDLAAIGAGKGLFVNGAKL
jgi:hypothetical protein